MRRSGRLVSVICVMAVLLCLAIGTTAQAEPKAYDYLLPAADTRNYTEEEIRDMPPQVITYAKNEIYARHGRKFMSQELAAWFGVQSWYSGTTEPEAFDPGILNSYETANIAALEKREKELGEDAYTLDLVGWDTQAVDSYLSAQASVPSIADGMELIHIFSTDYFSFDIPDVWAAIDFVCIPDTEDSISFYCKPAWGEEGQEDGKVCTVLREYEYVEPDYYPSAVYLGDRDGSYYYLLYPTDVRYDPSDQTVMGQYNAMREAAEEIPTTFVLK